MSININMREFTIALFYCLSAIFTVSAQTIDDSTQNKQAINNNAILNGIIFTSSPGEKPFEKDISIKLNITGKPSSWFYEVHLKEKKFVLEFNDTKLNSKLDTPELQPPFLGYYADEIRINANKYEKDTTPDWHDKTKITFDFSFFPKVRLSDELDSNCFEYKWTTDTSKINKYITKDNKGSGLLPYLILRFLGDVSIGIIIWSFLSLVN